MPPLIQVGNVLLATDILTECFCCNLEACHGQCCVEGDAGAPVTLDETARIESILPTLWQHLSASAQAVIDKQGVAYTDQEGDLVTSIVGNSDCVFTCHEQGCCLCVIEKTQRQQQHDTPKPISCSLYPIREVQLRNGLIGLNYHRWQICQPARQLGQQRNLPLYRFLRQPLIRRFGKEWYDELALAARQLAEQYGNNAQK